MVSVPPLDLRAWVPKGIRALFVSGVVVLLFSCGTTDGARLKESREAYLRGDFQSAEKSLFSKEVLKNQQNRLQHYYLLASIGMSEGLFEKGIYFLNRARDVANSVRSDSGGFEWFSSDYESNPIEFSYLHYMLIMAYTALANQGKTSAWELAEIKDEQGQILVLGQKFPERTFSPKEIADLRQKARAELLAWDTFLTALKRSHPNDDYYKEDLWARLLGSYLHASSSSNNEKRTGELLIDQAKRIFDHEFSKLSTASEQSTAVLKLMDDLQTRAKNNKSHPGSLLVCEAGVMPKPKIKRFFVGLSTLFKQIRDPYLRSQMEQLGLHIIANEAPEFGLVLFTGALAGAVSGSTPGEDEEFDGPPRFFSDAVDRSFGFEIRFPSVRFPPKDTQWGIRLVGKNGVSQEVNLVSVAPIQDMLATELKNREGDMQARAIKIGFQYLAILIPAIKAYRQAVREGNVFKRLGVLAGYYISKKVIDKSNEPDLRSWNTLPRTIVSQWLTQPPGDYQMILSIQNAHGRFEQDLGQVRVGDPAQNLIYKRVGDISILNL